MKHETNRTLRNAAWSIVLTTVGLGSAPLPAKPLDGCGEGHVVDVCPVSGDCRQAPVFDVPDYWHGLAQCMRALRNVWSKQGPQQRVPVAGARVEVAKLVRQQVLRELSLDHVGVRDPVTKALRPYAQAANADGELAGDGDLLVLRNDLGQPYNAMGQSGLAYFLYQMAGLAERGGYPLAASDAKLYRSLARGAVRTVVTPVEAGGLARSRSCGAGHTEAACSWYHSITRRDLPTGAGATLNQNLHAIRDLGLIADLARRQQWHEDIDFEAAIAAGLNQLAFSDGARAAGNVPNLQDFLAPPTGDQKVRWAFYGWNTLAPAGKGPYFLGRGSKDCAYHLHVLDLFSQVLQRQQRLGGLDRYRDALLGCGSPLSALYRTIDLRRTHKDRPSAWSSNESGIDHSCPASIDRPADGDTGDNLAFLKERFKSCDQKP